MIGKAAEGTMDVVDTVGDVAQTVNPIAIVKKKTSKQEVVTLPFYSVETWTYIEYLNKFRPDPLEEKDEDYPIVTCSKEDFKTSFEDLPGWENHFNEGSLLNKLLDDDYFIPYKEDKPDELSIDRLALLGILLCKGNALARAEALWTVV